MDRQYYVYIVTNKANRVLYTGVTNDLKKGLTNTEKSWLRDLRKDIMSVNLSTMRSVEM